MKVEIPKETLKEADLMHSDFGKQSRQAERENKYNRKVRNLWDPKNTKDKKIQKDFEKFLHAKELRHDPKFKGTFDQRMLDLIKKQMVEKPMEKSQEELKEEARIKRREGRGLSNKKSRPASNSPRKCWNPFEKGAYEKEEDIPEAVLDEMVLKKLEKDFYCMITGQKGDDSEYKKKKRHLFKGDFMKSIQKGTYF